nr:tail fiber protein [uncultured Enterobacter sp.]
MKTSLSLVVATTALLAFSSGAQACEGEGEFIGAVCFTAATFCPSGYLDANGQTVLVNQFQGLYSLVGNHYGGTPGVNFTLPNLQGFSPAGQGTGPGLTNAAQYSTRGAESQTLTQAQLPAHTHTATLNPTATGLSVNASTSPGANAAPSAANNQLATATPNAKIYAPASTGSDTVPLAGLAGGIAGAAVALATTGGGMPITTVSPQLVLKACIAYDGDYPVNPN